MGRERGRALARGLTCSLAPGHTDISGSSDASVHFTANVIICPSVIFQALHNIVQFYVFSPCSHFSSKYIFSSSPTGLLIFSRAYSFLWCLCLTCSLCFHCYPQTCPSITFPYIIKELFKGISYIDLYFRKAEKNLASV